ncbi:5-dehydro-2-deoxygluconokinase [Veronia pacifica]|uniref:5-dehydro-2-deoxygluconokinase n=1 Tax=Veronia pacifica TaxID=1080227 RepID=A0A1C3EMP2_9GAMM|nr:5-dehydro-2-deoxygluconokinase [Veronia pacifica]ODA34506.1 5-dehydro-2-deoxygluconokinase [Veronia pacifica]
MSKEDLVLTGWQNHVSREIDVICLGRAGVDLYGQQPEQPFGALVSFYKSVGGSPANIASGLSALGARTGFIGGVSQDGLGDYVCQFLKERQIDLTGMKKFTGEYRTSLALAELRQQPEVVIYRNQAADLAIDASDISSSYLARARCLVVSGTALSLSPSREATLHAMTLARQHDLKVVLDLDYRAYSWRDSPSEQYQRASELSDVVIGNREEFSVLSTGSDNEYASLSDINTAERLLKNSRTQLVIIKAGELGCEVFGRNNQGQITSFKQGIFPVTAQKPYGAGDAFAAALLYGLLYQYAIHDAVAMGAANAAINVMGTTCAEDMASLSVLLDFMTQNNYSVTGSRLT